MHIIQITIYVLTLVACVCVCRVKGKAGFENCPAEMVRVEFVINTYADLQPFLEMAVLLLEGIYEHKMVHAPLPSQSHE